MPLLSKMEPNRKNVLAFGKPKSGKSTFAYSAPGFIISFNYDGGSPAAPPGVDASQVFIQNYPIPEQSVDLDKNKWVTVSNVAKAIITDIREVNEAFRQKRLVKLQDAQTGEKVELPLPTTLILDGCVELYDHVGWWILANDGKTGPEAYSNRYDFYT